MSIYESVEYHPYCPSCGAANVGNDVCDYCGASLIKSKTNREETKDEMEEQERINALEDYKYEEIKGKLREKDDFLLLFCPIFGGAFVIVPTIVCIAFMGTGILEFWLIPFFSLFWLIGIGALVPLFKQLTEGHKCKTGDLVTGTLRGYEDSMTVVNGRPQLNMRILLNDAYDPKILVLKTPFTVKKYPVGAQIRLKRYKDSYIFDK